MKRQILNVLIVALLTVVFAGCQVSVEPQLPAGQEDAEAREVAFDVDVNLPLARGVNDDPNVAHVYIKVFSSDHKTVLTPTTPAAGETAATEIYKNAQSGKFQGNVAVTGASGTVYLVAIVKNAAGEHLYTGFASADASGGHVQIITSKASDGYTTGGTPVTNWGPGGGYVFYKNTTTRTLYEVYKPDLGTNTQTNANNACTNLVAGGYDDWVLPSYDVVGYLANNDTVGSTAFGFTSADYWTSSSSGGGGNNFWARNPITGAATSTNRNQNRRFTAVRTFSYANGY
ncbi:MAG: DUF1566 domain-containing protein [Spirochaetaceae bacterium]|nr:DUF1566 domain-containing protein [Spirochaetaceae bacterium]